MKKIKVLSLFLCFALLFCSSSIPVCAASGVLGDVDGDGVVGTQDARQILKMAARIIPADLTTADMNGDGVIGIDDVIQALEKASNIEGGVVIPDKNGENYLSDDPNNEFISLVASKFNVDKRSLVAIYSLPDSGTNYVLQFKAKGVGNKTYEKSPANLQRVYHITAAPERKISYTSGSLISGNYNCTAAEGVLVFNLIKTKVMYQYPEYFTGL